MKKSKYSIKLNKEVLKTKDKFKIMIEGTIKETTMSNKMPEWFKIWNENTFIPFKNKVEERLDKIEERLDKIEKDVLAIKNCPTIKKELDLK